MSSILARRLPLVIGAAMALTLSGQAALAQTDEQAVSPAAINADTVDGKSAVGFTKNRAYRAYRLVATSSAGYLPNNIIKKAANANKLDGLDSTAFATLAALQSSAGAVNEADNLVSWNQLMDVPLGFADGVDEGDGYYSQGRDLSPVLAPNATAWIVVDTTISFDVEASFFPVVSGCWLRVEEYWVYRTNATTVRHAWLVKNESNDTDTLSTAIKPRIRVFFQGIAPAKAKQAIKKVTWTRQAPG